MAKNPNPYGPQALTVQEATNAMAQRRVIRVIPTLDNGTAYTQHDVLFDSTEIPDAVLQPGGCSKLMRVSIHNHMDTTCDIDLVFTQNQANLGTLNGVAGSGSLWTEALAKASKVLGGMQIDSDDNEMDLVNSLLIATPGSLAASGPQYPMLLQASENSTSVYFAGMDRTGGIDFGANDLEFIFHIEY